MTDKEKVRAGLKYHFNDESSCMGCPYYGYKGATCYEILMKDALEMMNEAEAVKPEFDSLDGNVGRWRCGKCHISLGAIRAPYCWHCGRQVKWE